MSLSCLICLVILLSSITSDVWSYSIQSAPAAQYYCAAARACEVCSGNGCPMDISVFNTREQCAAHCPEAPDCYSCLSTSTGPSCQPATAMTCSINPSYETRDACNAACQIPSHSTLAPALSSCYLCQFGIGSANCRAASGFSCQLNPYAYISEDVCKRSCISGATTSVPAVPQQYYCDGSACAVCDSSTCRQETRLYETLAACSSNCPAVRKRPNDCFVCGTSGTCSRAVGDACDDVPPYADLNECNDNCLTCGTYAFVTGSIWSTWSTQSVPSFVSCLDKCHSNPFCLTAQYFPANKTCSFSRETLDCTIPRQTTATVHPTTPIVAGCLDCRSTRRTQSQGCQRYGIQTMSSIDATNFWTSESARTLKQCLQKCEANPFCLAVQFVPDSETCRFSRLRNDCAGPQQFTDTYEVTGPVFVGCFYCADTS